MNELVDELDEIKMLIEQTIDIINGKFDDKEFYPFFKPEMKLAAKNGAKEFLKMYNTWYKSLEV